MSTDRCGDRAAVRLAGELDLSTVPIADAELRRAQTNHARIVLDLRQLTFMDSTGLHLVICAHSRLLSQGGSLALIVGQGQVRRLLELTGVDAQLELVDEPPQLLDRPPQSGLSDEAPAAPLPLAASDPSGAARTTDHGFDHPQGHSPMAPEQLRQTAAWLRFFSGYTLRPPLH